jgi:hypothetical protein
MLTSPSFFLPRRQSNNKSFLYEMKGLAACGPIVTMVSRLSNHFLYRAGPSIAVGKAGI